jgi:hypothetical protein
MIPQNIPAEWTDAMNTVSGLLAPHESCSRRVGVMKARVHRAFSDPLISGGWKVPPPWQRASYVLHKVCKEVYGGRQGVSYQNCPPLPSAGYSGLSVLRRCCEEIYGLKKFDQNDTNSHACSKVCCIIHGRDNDHNGKCV